MNKNLSSSFTNTIYKFILLIAAVFLFFISNPNPFIKEGVFVFAWISYFPVLLLINNCSIKNTCLFGLLYGVMSYAAYGYWLHAFHPLALFIVCICYGIIWGFSFLGLKIIQKIFPENGWIVQVLFLCSCEYLKTKGFIGFSYGVTAYTQWKNLYFIQIADIIGVFGINLLIIFPSAWVYNLFVNKKNKFFYTAACVWTIAFIGVLIYGYVDIKSENNNYKTVKVAAIQNNEDPWKNGLKEYSNNIQTLKQLTDEAYEFYPDIDFVLWPETSVVPSIMYHFYKLVDENRFRIVYSLLNYIDSKNSVFIIGNSHEEENKKKNTDRYNNSMVFVPEENTIPPEPEMYSKIHLVPFTETFPYKYQFPWLYKRLLNGDTHMWESGIEYKVFEKKGLKFSTPICFEDTFGDDCRKFTLNGARCFMNMSNDAWSGSSTCQYQHLSMAVFRSVENNIPTIRSTSSGQTCYINTNGKIEKMIPEFCSSYLVCDVPVLSEHFDLSIYSKYGDIAGIIEVVITVLLLIIQMIHVIIIKSFRKKTK